MDGSIFHPLQKTKRGHTYLFRLLLLSPIRLGSHFPQACMLAGALFSYNSIWIQPTASAVNWGETLEY